MESVPPIWVPGMAIEDGMLANRSTGNCDQHPWRVLSLLCSSQPRTCRRVVLKSWRNLHCPKKLAIKFPKLMSTSQSLQHSALHQWVYQSLSLKPRFKCSIFLVPNLPPKPRTQLSNRTYEAPLSLHQGSFYYLCMEPSARGGFHHLPNRRFQLGETLKKNKQNPPVDFSPERTLLFVPPMHPHIVGCISIDAPFSKNTRCWIPARQPLPLINPWGNSSYP